MTRRRHIIAVNLEDAAIHAKAKKLSKDKYGKVNVSLLIREWIEASPRTGGEQ